MSMLALHAMSWPKLFCARVRATDNRSAFQVNDRCRVMQHHNAFIDFYADRSTFEWRSYVNMVYVTVVAGFCVVRLRCWSWKWNSRIIEAEMMWLAIDKVARPVSLTHLRIRTKESGTFRFTQFILQFSVKWYTDQSKFVLSSIADFPLLLFTHFGDSMTMLVRAYSLAHILRLASTLHLCVHFLPDVLFSLANDFDALV